MELFIGAIIFAVGLVVGMMIPTKEDIPAENPLKDIYTVEYESNTKGLYAPVRRGGKEI